MLARRRYPAVEAWRARIRAAEARLYAARAAFFPLVSAEGRYLRLEDAIEAEIPIITLAGPSTETVTFQETEAFSLSTQLRYTLFDWSRNQLVQGARAHELRAEEWWRRRALQEVDWAVARGYFGALLGRSDIEVLQASALALERAVTEARQLLDAGRATEADVLVLEATLERRRFEVRQAEDLLRDFEEELRRLLDLEPDASMPLAGGESEPEPPPALPRLEGLAIERRPEFRELREREEALRADSRAAGASWLPEFFFFVQNDVTDSPTVLTERTLFSGGFGVSWTVFDGGRRFHEMHALRAEAEALFAGQRELRGAIVLEVRKAHRDGARAIEGVAVARSVVESAGENLLRVEERFRAGGATGQELLEAEALLTSERARLERALHGARLQRARLRLALGLDPWEPLAPP
jgi:outer membrane protein TolC